MNKKSAIIVSLQAFLIVILFWMLVFYGRDEYEAYVQGEIEEEIETPERIIAENGITYVALERAAQEQSGITTVTLEASQFFSALTTYGNVVSIDDLLNQRTRYLSAKAELDMARASLTNSQQEFDRLSKLNLDDRNVSDRAVANAAALLKTDQARVAAAESLIKALQDNMRLQWGESLMRQATQGTASSELNRILANEEVLIQITLPYGIPAPKLGNSVRVTPLSAPGNEISAQFVSASPKTDTTILGDTYYFRAPATSLRIGMRDKVRMNEHEAAETGVNVPRTAIVWHGGQAWCYRKSGEDKFSRGFVSTDQETEDGWFNVGRLLPGDEIVTTGAQLLLSEEFKYQIKNENDD